MTLHTKSLAELAAGLRAREFSSVELTRTLLARIETHQPRLNALISVTGPSAMTCASRMLDNFVAPYDATVVAKLKAEGMVMLGKANMDEFAMGSSNETSYFGPVRNPWNPQRVPGGSSGGSAAVVAARLAPFASATDTGGSIRQPAALIGLLKEFFEKGLDPQNERCVRDALAVYVKLGAKLVEVSLPNLGLSVPAYYVVAPAECSSNLARFDGVRFGHRAKDARDLTDLYKRSRGEGFGAEVKRRIMTGTYVLSAGYYDAFYLKAQKVRRLIAADFAQAFKTVDVLMGPTTPTVAFELGSKTADPITMYLNDIYTIGANLAGLPAMSIPCGFVQDLPVGLQIIGRHFAEERLLSAAHAYQQETDWHTRVPPGYE